MADIDKKVAAAAATDGAKTVILTQDKAEPVMIICEVCGHANPEHTALCKMCSNYLEGV